MDTSHTGYILDCFVKYKNIISNRFESIYLFSVTLGVWTVNSVAHITALVLLVRIAHIAIFVGTVRFLNWAPILEVASNTGVWNIAMKPRYLSLCLGQIKMIPSHHMGFPLHYHHNITHLVCWEHDHHGHRYHSNTTGIRGFKTKILILTVPFRHHLHKGIWNKDISINCICIKKCTYIKYN